MKLRIDVTKEDIEAVPEWGFVGRTCMVGRAFERCTEGAFQSWWVGYTQISYGAPGRLRPVRLPARVTRAIHLYDDKRLNAGVSRHSIEPFSFEVEIEPDAGESA